MKPNIAENICEAITTIVDKSISEAGYDKTVQAKIVSVIDSTVGSYKISYQDSLFTAYATSTDVTYTKNATVYVLIPSGDFSNDKTILGTVEKLGINYVNIIEGTDGYDINGINVITSNETFELSSYKTENIVLYSKNSENNLIDVDTTAVEQYLKNSENLICGMAIKTSIPVENQYGGDYGIKFKLDFTDSVTGENVTKTCTINVDKMSGTPYKFLHKTEQYGIFEHDYENFDAINSIELYCENFENQNTNGVSDIFISDISIRGATPLTTEDLDSYTLTISTPQGTYFTDSDSDSSTITLQAQVRVKGKVINTDSQDLEYYWFTENANINSKSYLYNTYGGQGWKCLNSYNVITGDEEDTSSVEWVKGDYQYKIKKTDIVASAVSYKCAVKYDETILTKTITVNNLDAAYTVTIDSDQGTQFYFDEGERPILTCSVSNANKNSTTNNNFTYSWSQTTSDGVYTSLDDTTEENDAYENLIEEYNSLLNDIASGSAYLSTSQTLINNYENSIEAFKKKQRVKDNQIFYVDITSFTGSWCKYTCTVYYDEQYIGTASITISNARQTEGTYTLALNNGSYVYKYDANGISPASSSLTNPISIQPISFTIYNNLGEAVSSETNNCRSVQWIVPTANTMLEFPSEYEAVETTDTTATYNDLTSLSYTIKSSYKTGNINNDITLLIDYQGISLSATTSLVFTKEGEIGTNGTDYFCRIVPNTTDSVKYVTITEPSGGTSLAALNFTEADQQWLKLNFYKNEELILSCDSGKTEGTSSEGEKAEIEWSILRNTYSIVTGNNAIDSSSFTHTSLDSKGNLYFKYVGNTNKEEDFQPANIIKAKVTYKDVEYYATLPIISIIMKNDDYKITLKEGSGYQYVTYTSDGQNPKYDNSNPFEIIVTKKIIEKGVTYWEDISLSEVEKLKPTYNWKILGSIQTKTNGTWKTESSIHLKQSTASSLQNNQKNYTPISNFDGECVNNAIRCVVSVDENEIGTIHIPIHLYLNRYGLSALNGWDGNSVSIDSEGGSILAPQIGAGIKNSDNSFTGIVMGQVKESGGSAEVGLFGYAKGQRSIFLNAEDGSATFGVTGQGQIVLDPSNGKAIIQSGNYKTGDNGEGMQIDLTTPSITFGSGNFSVDSNGFLTAKGGGSIAGWDISDGALSSKYEVDENTTYRAIMASAPQSASINGIQDSEIQLNFNNKFGVNAFGHMYAATATIGSGTNKIYVGRSSTDVSSIYNNKASLNDTNSGFYIGTDGIALGSSTEYDIQDDDGTTTKETIAKFQVTKDGTLQATTGHIGSPTKGWTIKPQALTTDSYVNYSFSQIKAAIDDGGEELKDGGVFLGTRGLALGSSFYVTQAGVLQAFSGTIGGWVLGQDSLSAGNITLNSEGSISGGTEKNQWSINTKGLATFKNLVAEEAGTIGGWTIGNKGTLSGNNITLDGVNGQIYQGTEGAGKGAWTISGGGAATFSDITVTGGSITIGGTTITGDSTTLDADSTKVSTSGSSSSGGSGSSSSSSLPDYIKGQYDELIVTTSFSYGNYDCVWQELDFIDAVYLNYNAALVNNSSTINGYFLTRHRTKLYVLAGTYGYDENDN